MNNRITKLEGVFFLAAIAVFLWSGVRPKDYLTWFLEVVPSIIGFGLIIWNWKSFRLSQFLFILICAHSIILSVGGHYTYAEVPVGDWLKSWFNLSRNHYDRLGHFFQGFQPAFLCREILLRKNIVKKSYWLSFIVISVCLAFSAFYELIEFAAAIGLNSSAEAFLGTQGDIWDTQKDMLMALIGATSALFFSKWHDQSMTNKIGS